MQTHVYDSFEFESLSSEETLHLVIARKRECPSARIFLEQSKGERFRYAANAEKGAYKTKREVRRETKRRHREVSLSPPNGCAPMPLNEYPNAKLLRTHATRFGCFPEPIENFAVVAMLQTPPITPLNTEVLLESEHYFVWYKWYSTA